MRYEKEKNSIIKFFLYLSIIEQDEVLIERIRLCELHHRQNLRVHLSRYSHVTYYDLISLIFFLQVLSYFQPSMFI